MRTIRTAFLTGAVSVLVGGAFSMAAAGGQDTHTMALRLPGGAVEQIRYSGDVPPQIIVTPDATRLEFGWPVAYFDPAPFAAFDRISTEMDRQMSAMLRNANALAAESLSNPQALTEIEAGALPAGSEHYSIVSTSGGNVLCARSVEIASRGPGQKPKVVSKTYGNCGNSAASGTGVESASPADRPSDVRDIGYAPRNASAGAVREARAAY
ncbi:MAG TPA: hypothetical protein VIY09_03165 [Rhizomicrobium sp.]